MGLDMILGNNPIVIFLVLIWTILWKGIALWKAAKLGQRNWFIVILIISSLGIIELVYLFGFAKEKLSLKEIRSWFKSKKGS